jgi:hypothetical protein
MNFMMEAMLQDERLEGYEQCSLQAGNTHSILLLPAWIAIKSLTEMANSKKRTSISDHISLLKILCQLVHPHVA